MGATKSWVLNTDPNSYHAALDPCKALLAKLEEHTATFKGYVERPGGSHWESKFADAAQANAGSGYKTVARMRDIMDAADREMAGTIDGSLTPQLANAKHMIEHALQQQGVTVNDDLSMTYTPPHGMSDEDADHNRQVVQQWAKELKASGDQAWSAAEHVGQQANAAGEKVLGEVNAAAALFNVDKAAADTRPKDAPPPPDASGNFYKDWYPKASPASTEAAAVVAPADPNAPKLGPTAVPDKPAVDPKTLGSLGSVTSFLEANRKPDDKPAEKPADQPAPQSKGFLDGWVDEAKQKAEGIVDHAGDLIGLHGGEKFKDAWIDTGIGIVKDALDEATGNPGHVPTPLDQTLEAYNKAEYAKTHGGSAASLAGAGLFDLQAKSAGAAAALATDGLGRVFERGIVDGAVGAESKAALAEGVPTLDSTLHNTVKGFLDNAMNPHIEAPPIPHAEAPTAPHLETPSLPHAETPAAPHVETPAAPRVETPQLPHSDTSAAPHMEAPTAPHVETPSPPHAETPAAPHVETPATPHSDTPAAPHVEHHNGPGAAADHSGSPSGDHGGSETGEHSGAPSAAGHSPAPTPSSPIEGHDYGFSPTKAFEILQNPADDIARLREAGVPSHVLEGYDQLAGRSIDEFEKEFTVPGRDGLPRWDWETHAPNHGFAEEPMVADRIPKGQLLDRFGSERGAFMADDGAPLGTRGMPPGVASDYNRYAGTGLQIPEDLNAKVLYGPAKEAFGQPGGANQWVVVDKDTLQEIPVEILKRNGIVEDVKPPNK